MTIATVLGLAAAPTFAVMAVLMDILGGGQMMICGGPDASPLTGMVFMYVLMSALHLGPWARVISRWRSGWIA